MSKEAQLQNHIKDFEQLKATLASLKVKMDSLTHKYALYKMANPSSEDDVQRTIISIAENINEVLHSCSQELFQVDKSIKK